ncbi:MAG TPA: STAS domain-containing protein [Roseiflexaceae bacterium]|nr:STAS domain-containing protein [Roseiflexaceae bacterium]
MVATTSITARPASAEAAVLDIRGDITGSSEPMLMSAYAEACGRRAKVILLNFAGLEYMNSGGIGLLVTLLIRARRANQRLLACGLSEHYRQIFELTRLNDAIGIYTDEEDALRAV